MSSANKSPWLKFISIFDLLFHPADESRSTLAALDEDEVQNLSELGRKIRLEERRKTAWLRHRFTKKHGGG